MRTVAQRQSAAVITATTRFTATTTALSSVSLNSRRFHSMASNNLTRPPMMRTNSISGTNFPNTQPHIYSHSLLSPSASIRQHATAAAAAPHKSGCSCCHGSEDAAQESGSESFLADVGASVAALKDAQQSLDSDATATPTDSSSSNATKWQLKDLLTHNHKFVMNKNYEQYLTDKFPYKKLVVVTCMDTRLTELLPVALDLKNGDAKIVKVAGAMVAHPFGSVMRSILVAVYALGAEHILVVGHHDCGMTGMDPNRILTQAKQRSIPDSTFKTLRAAGLDLDGWLSGFEDVRTSVLHSVETIKNHPLLSFDETSIKASEAITPGGSTDGKAPPAVAKMRIPKISVSGFVICPTTGKLDLVTPTNEENMALLERQARELDAARSKKEAEASN